jgi:hypothetical protein
MHDRYCFCSDCCEDRKETEDMPVYEDWRRAFPNLPWDES